MGLFNWRKKQPEPTPQAVPDLPRITFEMTNDSSVNVYCSWPPPANGEDAANTIQKFALLAFLCSTGKLHPAVQQAIANFNTDDEISNKMARAILSGIQQIMQNNGVLTLTKGKGTPVVSPREAFAVRGPQE